MHVLDLFAETSLEEEAAFLAKQSMKEAAGVGVVKGGKDPRYMTATMGNQNDVTGSTLGKEMKAYFPTKPPKIQHQKQIKNSVAETADVTDYNPPSQGGTRRELVAKYHQTKDPKDAEAARRAGATQQELQGVAEGLWFRTTYGWAGGEKPGGGKYKHPETVAAERRAKLAAKKKAEQAAKFGKSDAEPGVAEEGYRSRHAWLNHGVTTKWPSAKIRRVKINGQRIDQALVHNVVVGEWNLASKTGFVNSPANTPELAEQQAGNAAFSPEEIAAINQYLDDEISFIELRRGYPGVIRKAARHFGTGSTRGFQGEMDFYDRMVQARDEGDIAKQGVAEGAIPEDMFRTKAEVENPVDSVKLDIPLLIRIMEYAREDAKTDLDLHDIAERLISISRSGNTLSMRDYDRIVGKEARPMLTNRH